MALSTSDTAVFLSAGDAAVEIPLVILHVDLTDLTLAVDVILVDLPGITPC